VLSGVFVRDRAMGRVAGTSHAAIGVFAVGASKLIHEIGDHSVKVKAVVEAFVGQTNEITARNRHFVDVDLCLKIAHGCFEFCNGVAHRFCTNRKRVRDQGARIALVLNCPLNLGLNPLVFGVSC